MRVALHQPHYLPWLGLIDKIDRSDLFVYLDHVQFERGGWQNRNYIASKGGPVMLTVPVVQRSRGERIVDKRIDNSNNWRSRHRLAIGKFNYRNAPHWGEFGEEILGLYAANWEHLADLAVASTRLILDRFGITTPIVRSSELGEFDGQKSDLVAKVAQKAGATTVLSGDGARGYTDESAFASRGLNLEWQNFQHPVYRQFSREGEEFLPRMAAIDLLLNVGIEGIDLLRTARRGSG